jgi:murein DD-endopeptidase MepM/ murein hydrolase activator NlpD
MSLITYPLRQQTPKPNNSDFLDRPGRYGTTLYNPEGRHLAIDLAAREGTDALAVLPGHVTHAGPYGALGNAIAFIDDRYGYEWWYAHLSRVRVTRGTRIERGQHIGDVGHTGNASGDHLHLAVLAAPLIGRPWGSLPFIDPYPLLLDAWRDLDNA